MPFYHVRITEKSSQSKGELRLDLTIEELERRILSPYSKGQSITIAGKSLAVDEIDRIRINKTDKKSEALRATAKQKRRNSRVVRLFSVDWDIAAMGEEVTDQFITAPPGSEANATPTLPSELRPATDAQEVFVVHGRNDKARDALFQFLGSVGLRPLEWSEAVQSTGKPTPYIGEILDAAFSRAHAVVVLLTPDDEAQLREQLRVNSDPLYEFHLTGQARPNVLFEAGMGMARHPDRTVLIELGNLRPFSDIAGRHVLRLDDSVAQRQALAQRLQSAGCPVKLEGTTWHSAGSFKDALPDESTGMKASSTDSSSLEEQRFDEMFRASMQLRERISNISLNPTGMTKFEIENIAIDSWALAGQMSALGMNELHERLVSKEESIEKLYKISGMLGFFEVHVRNKRFEAAKRQFSSYDPTEDDRFDI